MLQLILGVVMFFPTIEENFNLEIGKNNLLIFPNEKEIAIYNKKDNSFSTLLQIKDKDSFLVFDSISTLNDMLIYTIKNESEARFHVVPGRINELYQNGTSYYEKYSMDLKGMKSLITKTKVRAINADSLEIITTNFYLNKTLTDCRIVPNIKPAGSFDIYGISVVENKDFKVSIEKGSLYMIKPYQDKRLILLNENMCNQKKDLCGCYDLYVNADNTKVLFSYFSFKKNNSKETDCCIFEFNVKDERLIRYNICGLSASLSSDESYILYREFYSNNFEIYNIKQNTKKKLPDCKYAIWVK
jgi:hypothetical protein